MLKTARNYKKELNKLASSIYIESESYAFGELFIKPKPVDLATDEITEHDVVFNEIKNTIIQGIRGAKYTI